MKDPDCLRQGSSACGVFHQLGDGLTYQTPMAIGGFLNTRHSLIRWIKLRLVANPIIIGGWSAGWVHPSGVNLHEFDLRPRRAVRNSQTPFEMSRFHAFLVKDTRLGKDTARRATPVDAHRSSLFMGTSLTTNFFRGPFRIREFT